MADVRIDLGELRETTRPAPVPPFPHRALLAGLSVVLVALLAGAQPLRPPQPPTVLPARLGDAVHLAGDRLHVVGTGMISTYVLPTGKLVGRTPVSVPGAVLDVQQIGDILLVPYQRTGGGEQAVTALAAGTGRQLWQRTARMVAAHPADGLVLLGDDRADYAVDLSTGALRWTVRRPADGFIAEAGGDGGQVDWLVLITDSGRLETRDARTGRVIATIRVPPRTGRANGLIWPSGDLLLVDSAGAGFDGYRLPGLTRRWHTPVDLRQSWMQADCGAVVCTYQRKRGLTALDPDTGQVAWHSGRWTSAQLAGGYLLATAGETGPGLPRLWVLDPADGTVVGDFGAWQQLGPATGGLVYGKLDRAGAYTIWYGLLDPATRRVRILGSGERVSGECQTAAGVLLCRLVDASIALWRLR